MRNDPRSHRQTPDGRRLTTRAHRYDPPTSWILPTAIAIAVVALTSVTANDHLRMGIGLLGEGPPAFDEYYLVRSLTMLFCSTLLVSAVWMKRRPPTHQPLNLASVAAIHASSALAILLTLAFVWSPAAFSRIAREDGIVESTSAVALFLAGVVFLVAGFGRASRERRAKNGSVACAILAFLMLLFGMEEISWGQRIFGFETPAFFSSNLQQETNLHNFITNPAENMYYVGSFLILIAVPYLDEAFRFTATFRSLANVVPDRAVALVAAPLVAFTWDMWNIIPMQMTFYLTIAILIVMLRDAMNRGRSEIQTIATALIATLVVQILFLIFGHQLVRPWGATEYRELFISLAFLFYALKVASNMRAFKQAADPRVAPNDHRC